MVTSATTRAPATAPAPAPTPTGGGSRLHAIDGFRFLAALGVVLYHFTVRWSTVWGEDPWERFGFGHLVMYFVLAPEFFFVVSGFVILWTAWGRSVANVVASRLSRVYPAYWTALALTSFLLLVVWPQGKRINLAEVAVNTTLLQEAFDVRHVDGVYWTLWTELRFYLLMTAFVAFGITRRRLLVVAALWPLAGMAVDALGWGFLSTLLISQYAPLFAGGMLLFLIYREGHRPVPWILLAGNVVLALHHVVPAQVGVLERNTPFTPSAVVLGLGVVGSFAAVGAASMTRLRDLRWPFLATLGALTYPLYLIHQFWGWWVIDVLPDAVPSGLALAAAFAVAVGLACLIHYGVERRVNTPVRRWLERRLALRAHSGSPPTSPGGSVPSRIPAQNASVSWASSSTVEPTPPGR